MFVRRMVVLYALMRMGVKPQNKSETRETFQGLTYITHMWYDLNNSRHPRGARVTKKRTAKRKELLPDRIETVRVSLVGFSFPTD